MRSIGEPKRLEQIALTDLVADCPLSRFNDAKAVSFLNTLSLVTGCVSGSNNVLALEWSDEEENLISMKRGDWEATLSGLPPYESKRSSKV